MWKIERYWAVFEKSEFILQVPSNQDVFIGLVGIKLYINSTNFLIIYVKEDILVIKL